MLTLEISTDSDWGGDVRRMGSTTGESIHLNGVQVDAVSRGHNVVALSSGDSEFYACSTGVVTGMRVRSILLGLGFYSEIRLKLLTDNQAATSSMHRPGHAGRMRHLDPIYCYMNELREECLLTVAYVGTVDNRADLYTKAVDLDVLTRLLRDVGLRKRGEVTGIQV